MSQNEFAKTEQINQGGNFYTVILADLALLLS